MRLQDKTAFITGSATAVKGTLMGIGGTSAWLFVREGAKVVIADVNESLGKVTASQIRDHGGAAVFVKLDVTQAESWNIAIQKTVAEYGGLDVLVNAAGNTVRHNVEETTLDTWEAQMSVHATGPFLGTKAVVPEMRKRGGGSIINISSIAGLRGSASSTAYHAAKGAVRLFTKAAAVQYAKENIRVNSIHPGFTMTPMTAEIFSDPAQINPRLERVPMGRLATPEEIAYGVLYLASDESSFVTGTELVIDGGFTAQ